jgi:hypothetical protein
MKNMGSSRIGVRSTELSKCPQFEVDEIPVPVGNAHYRPEGTIDALDKTVGYSLDEAVQDFLPAVAKGYDEFGKVLVACGIGFENPSPEEPGGLLFVLNRLEDAVKLLFEQIQGSKLGAQFEYLAELFLFGGRQFGSIPYKDPAAALDH